MIDLISVSIFKEKIYTDFLLSDSFVMYLVSHHFQGHDLCRFILISDIFAIYVVVIGVNISVTMACVVDLH